MLATPYSRANSTDDIFSKVKTKPCETGGLVNFNPIAQLGRLGEQVIFCKRNENGIMGGQKRPNVMECTATDKYRRKTCDWLNESVASRLSAAEWVPASTDQNRGIEWGKYDTTAEANYFFIM